MSVDRSLEPTLTEIKRLREQLAEAQRPLPVLPPFEHLPDPEDSPPLRGRGGGSTSGGVEERVTRLEVQMETVQRDLGEIKTDLRSTLEIVRSLPTKGDLSTFRWQWVATAVAAIALIVGGIIGGLGWIKPDAAAPAPAAAPVVIQVPAPASPQANRR